MGKIRNTNKRSEPSDRLPWGTKISKIRRQNKAFQSSFHFDGNMAVPKPDVVTHGIGEAGEESDNTKSIDGEKKTGFSLTQQLQLLLRPHCLRLALQSAPKIRMTM